MSEYLETVGFDLFEFEEGWAGKLEEPFGEWVKANHEWVFSEWPEDPSMQERLLKDEEEGGSIADFVNSLSDAQQRVAIEGMIALLERDEQTGGWLHEQLQSKLT